ncbi:hypothetical protein GCK32_010901, partial [Trichostrongylus colubriformis]
PPSTLNITGVVLAAQEEAHTQKDTKTGDKVNLPTNDITMMHEAIPFLPVPVALLCFLMNVFLPGSGMRKFRVRSQFFFAFSCCSLFPEDTDVMF